MTPSWKSEPSPGLWEIPRDKLAALRHDASVVLTKEGKQHILERTGPKDSTEDFKLREAIVREQSLSVPYWVYPRDESNPLVVDGFDSNVSTKVTMEPPPSLATGMAPPALPLPPVKFKSPGDKEGISDSDRMNSYLRETCVLEVVLEDAETHKTERWSTTAKTNYPAGDIKLSDLQHKAKEHVGKHPYSLHEHNCHELARHTNDVAGIENKPVAGVDSLMYRAAGSKPIVTSSGSGPKRGEQQQQEQQQEEDPEDNLPDLGSDYGAGMTGENWFATPAYDPFAPIFQGPDLFFSGMKM